MKLIAASVQTWFVAYGSTSAASMSSPSDDAGPFVNAAGDGGTLKMMAPTALESSTSGAVNSRNATPLPPTPGSYGKPA